MLLYIPQFFLWGDYEQETALYAACFFPRGVFCVRSVGCRSDSQGIVTQDERDFCTGFRLALNPE
ncbi:hypothetical protein FACS1894206_03610 [Deltaproteobacteria bacterium]|nr:hypothetical protein FACS1894206_03610 [Deltaproteobacteria bacterium]